MPSIWRENTNLKRSHFDSSLFIENAAQITLSPLGRQTVAMIISSAASNSQFAQIYMLYALIFPPKTESWTTYVRRALHLML